MKETLRKSETNKKYKKYLTEEYDGACIFCQRKKLLEEFNYWTLHKNEFPYDNIGLPLKFHLMLAPKRHLELEMEITNEEIIELYDIELGLDFDMRILNSKSKQSIPTHLHYHYIKFDN